MVNSEIMNWVMQQAGVVVVMGAVIWWLAKAYQEEKKRNIELGKSNRKSGLFLRRWPKRN